MRGNYFFQEMRFMMLTKDYYTEILGEFTEIHGVLVLQLLIVNDVD